MGACSTMRPAYITATRSAVWATIPRLWVMNSTARPSSALSLRQQGQDLGLDGHIQGGGGLIGDEQLRVAGQGHGNEDPLAQAAGKLVRVLAPGAGRRRGGPPG